MGLFDRQTKWGSIVCVMVVVLLPIAALPAHAAWATPVGKKVIIPEDLGVMHARVKDARSPSTMWHVFARCLSDTLGELYMHAFVLRQTRNITAGLLGFPVGMPDSFLQLGVGDDWMVLEGAARVQHPGLHPAHVRAGPLRSIEPLLKIEAAAAPVPLTSCFQAAAPEQLLVDDPALYIVYAGVQGLPLSLASHILQVHALHYVLRGVQGIRLYLAAANVEPILRHGGLHDALVDGFMQIVQWRAFRALQRHPRYLHAIAKHHAALAALGRATWLFFADLDEVLMPGDACAPFANIRSTCAQGAGVVLVPTYNMLCRKCALNMTWEQEVWLRRAQLTDVLEDMYPFITKKVDKETGFLGYHLVGDPTEAHPWIWGASRVWHKHGIAMEPIVRLEEGMALWQDADAVPPRLEGRGCLFVMRFPGLLFDFPGYGREWERVEFKRTCDGHV